MKKIIQFYSKNRHRLIAVTVAIAVTGTLLAAILQPVPARAAEVYIPSATTLLQSERLAHTTNIEERFERLETLEGATELLKSTEGAAWRVLAVYGPACTTEKGRACRDIKNKCTASSKFATKHKRHATCSSLYKTSTVLLTTAPSK